MDFKTVVFNAARDGNITRLKAYLHSWRTADEMNMFTGVKVGGATPLVIACRNGHYDVAEYLILRCKADIEQSGSVTFDGETIEGAPPLWCAAAAGHLALVKLLVRAGANVNSTTRTHSTPLRAACFDGHYEIVKFLVESGADIEIANRHGHTCLMIACYKGHLRIAKYLISLNADVNRKSVKGNTALHDCAESGSLNILKLMLGNGATMDVDSYGMTPLLAASVTGHTHIVVHLINHEYGLVTRQQRIDALELLGATYVDKRRDTVGAIALWKRAMKERFPTDGRDPIPKPKPVRVEAYEFALEPTNEEELDELHGDPDAMRMQALVLRERILGPAHPDTSYYVRYRGAVYADSGRFDRCRQLWHHALDMQRAVLPPLSPLTQSSLYSFAELFAYMLGERSRPAHRGRLVPPVTFEDIEPVFLKALSEIKRGKDLLESRVTIDREQTLATIQRVLVIALQLAALMARLLEDPNCTEEESFGIHRTVLQLVKLDVRVRMGRTALHVACFAESRRGAATCCPLLVGLMLRLGADPDARDAQGNTPLHLVCKLNPSLGDVIKELLANGAHIDTVNYDGDTPEDLLKHTNQSLSSIVFPLQFTSLKCIAARTVKNYRLPFKHVLPQCLHGFVLRH